MVFCKDTAKKFPQGHGKVSVVIYPHKINFVADVQPKNCVVPIGYATTRQSQDCVTAVNGLHCHADNVAALRQAVERDAAIFLRHLCRTF